MPEPAGSPVPEADPGLRKLRQPRDLRELRDPRDMRALAHPTRLALLEALTIEGPLTATQASELIGESPSSCSFHLRTLARHNFVEEAGGGTGRQRPWKLVTVGMSMTGPFDDPAADVAADALAAMFLDRQLARLRQWRSNGRPRETPEWVEAALDMEGIWWITADEARTINQQIYDLVFSFRDRLIDPSLRPPDARPVEALIYSFPMDLTDYYAGDHGHVAAGIGPVPGSSEPGVD